MKLGILGIISENYSLICKDDINKGIRGSQIDLVISRKDQIINLCEMKYYNSDYMLSEGEYNRIKIKINDLRMVSKTRFAIHPVLVTSYGLVDNMYSDVFHGVVTMKDLFLKSE